MGLLDIALDMLGGNEQQPNDPKAALLQAAIGMLSNSGGLQGLMGSLQNAGLGDALASWIGTGQNMPVSGEQIQQALGSGGQLEQLAQATGLSNSDAASQLSEMLPGLIDKITPNGELPQGRLGDLGGILGQLMGGLKQSG